MQRRDFLKIAAVATGSAVICVTWPLRSLVWRLILPVLQEAPPGQLGQQTLQSLLAATEALIDYPVELNHYADFFRWRAEHLPGHKALYDRFATVVDGAARRLDGCAFVACNKGTRQRILTMAFKVRHVQGRVSRLRVAILERDWLLFDQYVVRPTMSLFARTDVWRLVGYPAWPGTPRGLNYLRKTALRGEAAR